MLRICGVPALERRHQLRYHDNVRFHGRLFAWVIQRDYQSHADGDPGGNQCRAHHGGDKSSKRFYGTKRRGGRDQATKPGRRNYSQNGACRFCVRRESMDLPKCRILRQPGRDCGFDRAIRSGKDDDTQSSSGTVSSTERPDSSWKSRVAFYRSLLRHTLSVQLYSAE